MKRIIELENETLEIEEEVLLNKIGEGDSFGEYALIERTLR